MKTKSMTIKNNPIAGYILTLDFLREHSISVLSEDRNNEHEDLRKKQVALDILKRVREIEDLLPEIL